MSAHDRGATQDYSRGPSADRASGGPRRLLLLSGLLGAGLLVAADFSRLYDVRVLTVTKASVSGHAQHDYALVVVGLAAAAAGRRGSALGLGVLGLAALAVAGLSGDFHDVQSTGMIGALYENATAEPGRGFYLETLGAVALVAVGFGALLAGRGRSAGGPERVRPGAGAAGARDGEPGAERRGRAAEPEPPPRRRRGTGRTPEPDAEPAPRRRPPVDPGPAPEPESDPDDWFR